jgi:RES domain-containing protein
VRVWRLVRKRRLPDAFTGEGSRVAGGRWNSPGIRMVYTSTSLSLATLEYLVRANPLRAPHDIYSIWADVPDDLRLEIIRPDQLVKKWRQYDPPVQALRDLGHAWFIRARTAVLQVPSAIIPEENNFLLNPTHDDFVRIKTGQSMRVSFDGRLIR